MRVVVDINVLVSALIKPASRIGLVLEYLKLERFELLYFPRFLEEFQQICSRPHLVKKYHLKQSDVENIIQLLVLRGIMITVTTEVSVCRDPDDNILLSLAIDGNADYLVSGDNDLLVLNTISDISIIVPIAFLELLE